MPRAPIVIKYADIAVGILERSLRLGKRLARVDRSLLQKQTSAEVHLKKVEKVNREITDDLDRIFRYQITTIRTGLLSLNVNTATGSAETLLDRVFNPRDWDSRIIDSVLPVLARGMGESAVAFVLLMGVDIRKKRKPAVRSTASEWLETAGVELPPGLSSELPDWLKKEISQQLKDTFKQPYWKEISSTTRKDVLATLTTGLSNGESIRKISQRIAKAHGDEYTMNRARTVARTESGNALNAARDMTLKKLKSELGEAGKAIGKSWLSVLGATTRDSHANLDGVLADADGMWSLGGVRVPWPGHASLPAGERINCQCTIQTEFGANAPSQDDLEEILNPSTFAPIALDEPKPPKPKPKPKPKPPKPKPTQQPLSDDLRNPEAWKNWTLFEKLEKIPQLQEIHASVTGSSSKVAESAKRLIAAEKATIKKQTDLLRKHEKELKAWQKKYSAGSVSKKDYSSQLKNIKKEIDETNAYIRTAKEKVDSLTEKLKTPAIQIPKSERGSLSLKLTNVKSPKLKKAVKDAAEFIEAHCDGAVANKVKLSVKEVGEFARESQNGSVINLAGKSGKSVVAHEIAHFIEQKAVPGGVEKALEFLNERIRRAGTPDTPMQMFGWAYGAMEFGNEDSFGPLWQKKLMAFYNGKVYTKSGKVFATEVISMGSELMITNPKKFAQTDPEYFKFMVAFFRGWL